MGVGSSSRPEGREFQFCALQRGVHAPDLMVVMMMMEKYSIECVRAGGGAERRGEKQASIEMSSKGLCAEARAGEGSASLVLLQLSPDDEHPVGIRPRRHLLHVADGFEPLWALAPRDYHEDLETVADLGRGRASARVWGGAGGKVFWDRSMEGHASRRRGKEEWRCAETEGDVLRCGVPLRW